MCSSSQTQILNCFYKFKAKLTLTGTGSSHLLHSEPVKRTAHRFMCNGLFFRGSGAQKCDTVMFFHSIQAHGGAKPKVWEESLRAAEEEALTCNTWATSRPADPCRTVRAHYLRGCSFLLLQRCTRVCIQCCWPVTQSSAARSSYE